MMLTKKSLCCCWRQSYS